MSEQRANFLRDYSLKYYNVTELAEMYSVSRKTAYKWIDRYEGVGDEVAWRTSRVVLIAALGKHQSSSPRNW